MLTAAIIAGAGYATWHYAWRTPAVTYAFTTVNISRDSIERSISATDSVQALVTVDVSSQLSGQLSAVKGDFLSDLLNYSHLIDDGVILNKDGAFLMTFKFRGPDIHSATPAECDALTANFNRIVTFLEDGWMLHIDDLRIPSLTYPEVGAFPDSVSLLIDEERRQQYEQAGSHFENLQFLTFVWKFPLPIVRTTRHWFVDGRAKMKRVSI